MVHPKAQIAENHQDSLLQASSVATVLVVDDEVMVTRSIEVFLRLETEHQVFTFNSPQEALAQLATLKPDVILSDFLMPEMTGIEFLSQARQHLPDVTAILLTGYADKENAIQAINQAGIYRYLEKPWNNHELALHIQSGLERSRLVQNLRQTVGDLSAARNSLAQYNQTLTQQVAARTADLRQTHELLHSIIQNSADGVITLDESFAVTSINPTARAWLGMAQQSPSSAANHNDLLPGGGTEPPLAEAPDLTPLVTETAYQALLQALSPNMRPWTCEATRDTATGIHQVLEINASALPEVHGYVLILRDITERKTVERLREDFVATLTHDLRTPLLAALQTFVFFLDQSLGPLTEKQSTVLQTLQGSHQDLLYLVNTLLDVYRYESGRQRLIVDRVPVEELLSQLVDEHRSLSAQKQQSLSLFLPKPSTKNAHLQGDRHELRRVVANLLANAIRFTPVGGQITLSLEWEPPTPEQSARAVIAVTDNGRGIPAEDLPHLFQRFSQGTQQLRNSGSGLGLYLSRQIVEAHHGQMTVDSQIGAGSTFRVYLPAVWEEETPLAP
ncbi:MAG: ATP-binding protein [Candidatus Melainabacteria bacterium]|nr:ATP-binding protein [Candidatus Melainabacteria bacterium]